VSTAMVLREGTRVLLLGVVVLVLGQGRQERCAALVTVVMMVVVW